MRAVMGCRWDSPKKLSVPFSPGPKPGKGSHRNSIRLSVARNSIRGMFPLVVAAVGTTFPVLHCAGMTVQRTAFRATTQCAATIGKRQPVVHLRSVWWYVPPRKSLPAEFTLRFPLSSRVRHCRLLNVRRVPLVARRGHRVGVRGEFRK